MMVDYEIDINVLEDMCSDLEENAVLIDKNFRIFWMNKIIRERIAYHTSNIFKVGDHALTLEKIDAKKIFIELYGDDFSIDSPLNNVFKTGRFSKSLSLIGDLHIKKIFIPIKSGNDVAYVLEIIEQNHVEGNIAHAGHKDYLEATNSEKNTHFIQLIRVFMSSFEQPAFVTDKNNMLIATNNYFDKAFKEGDILRKYLLENIQKKSLAEIKKFVKMKYVLSKKNMIINKTIIGCLYTFRKIRSENIHKNKMSKKIIVKKR